MRWLGPAIWAAPHSRASPILSRHSGRAAAHLRPTQLSPHSTRMSLRPARLWPQAGMPRCRDGLEGFQAALGGARSRRGRAPAQAPRRRGRCQTRCAGC